MDEMIMGMSDEKGPANLGRPGAWDGEPGRLEAENILLSLHVICYFLVLFSVASCSIKDRKAGGKAEPNEVIEYRLSPDPAFLRMGQPLNFAITIKGTFDYLSADDCTWEESSGGSVVRFLSPGVVEGVSPGSASVTFKRKVATNQYQYPSIRVDVLPAKSLTSSPDREVVAAYYPWFSERH